MCICANKKKESWKGGGGCFRLLKGKTLISTYMWFDESMSVVFNLLYEVKFH